MEENRPSGSPDFGQNGVKKHPRCFTTEQNGLNAGLMERMNAALVKELRNAKAYRTNLRLQQMSGLDADAEDAHVGWYIQAVWWCPCAANWVLLCGISRTKVNVFWGGQALPTGLTPF